MFGRKTWNATLAFKMFHQYLSWSKMLNVEDKWRDIKPDLNILETLVLLNTSSKIPGMSEGVGHIKKDVRQTYKGVKSNLTCALSSVKSSHLFFKNSMAFVFKVFTFFFQNGKILLLYFFSLHFGQQSNKILE